MLSKMEQINFIIDESRRVSAEKDIKKREKRLAAAKIQLIKSAPIEVEDLWYRVKHEGAEKVFGKNKKEKAKK